MPTVAGAVEGGYRLYTSYMDSQCGMVAFSEINILGDCVPDFGFSSAFREYYVETPHGWADGYFVKTWFNDMGCTIFDRVESFEYSYADSCSSHYKSTYFAERPPLPPNSIAPT